MRKCDTKKFYDTEFEAIRAAALTEPLLKAEMIPYKCGNHWHISHKEKHLRGKYIPKVVRSHYCDICNQEMNPENYMKHIKKPRHLRLKQQKEESR